MGAASSATMDGRGIEIIVSDETGVTHQPDKTSRLSAGQAAMLKRIGTILLDNRSKSKKNCGHFVSQHPEEYKVLKRVLNIMFVTVGVALLASVFAVIVYTTVVGDSDKNQGSSQASEKQTEHPVPEPKNITMQSSKEAA